VAQGRSCGYHDHAGGEFIDVIQGTLSVHLKAEEHALEAGGSVYLDSTVPQAVACSAVVVSDA
jgi:quercetin dioxygenase-like cupin family protein